MNLSTPKLLALAGGLTALVTIGTYFDEAAHLYTDHGDDHVWVHSNQGALEFEIAQSKVDREALDRLIKIEEQRANAIEKKQRDQETIEKYDRELCARGVNPKPEEPRYCERRGYEKE